MSGQPNQVTGQRSATIDAMGEQTEFEYDSLGRTITTTRYLDSSAIETAVSYDALGNVVSRTDAEGNVSTTEYDTLYRTEKPIMLD